MTRKPKKEDWMKEKWRPMMGWMYMCVCITDFVIFPILWSILQAIYNGNVTSQWNPLTLQGAGLFHLAMGAVLGVAAWSRGQEKIAGAQNGYNISPNGPTTFSPYQTGGYDSSVDYSYATTTQTPVSGYGSSARTFTSRQGKPGPIIEEPEL